MSSEQSRKIINLLTVCIKAGKAIKGFDSVAEAIKLKKAYCTIVASDASARTVKEIKFIGSRYEIPMIQTEITKEELSCITGKSTAVIAVCDKGFSDKFLEIAEKKEAET